MGVDQWHRGWKIDPTPTMPHHFSNNCRSRRENDRRPVAARKRRARLLGALALTTACFVAVMAFPEQTASAYPYADINLVGHGWGHGMGMGQWGALGYSLDGQSYQQILTDYYGKLADGQTTSIGKLEGSGDSTIVRVAMTEEDGLEPVITSHTAFTIDHVPFAAGEAARFVPANGTDTLWNVYIASGGCSASSWTLHAYHVTNPTAVPGATETFPVDSQLANQVLELCEGGTPEGLRGNIEETSYSDSARTVDFVPLEAYVADVTPSESPAYWGTIGSAGSQGEPRGFQELEAQAVAARSYVMSDLGGWAGYADTCDLDCQSYPGITNENALTSLAVTDTEGVVVHMPGGQVATTQYSSSTGGWTVASTFAAVPDAGDSVCVPDACNPHHTWYASIPVSSVEKAFPSLGILESLQVTQRDGNGYFGGRVLQMSLVGSAGTVSMTGSDFATDFASYGMQSYWFEVTNEPSGGIGGYWLGASDGGIFSFGNAQYHGSMGGRRLNEPIVGMAATSDHKGYWLVASDGGIFSFGDAKFHGSMGARRLNAPIVAMASTPDGGGYWLVASDGGIFSFGDAKFHGSMGARHLNKPVVGMAVTPDGGGYWLVASDGGIFSFGNAKFYGSTGNLKLNKPIEAMARDTAGTGYWLVAQDGGIVSVGTAEYQGSLPGLGIVDDTADAMLPTSTGDGYLIVCADGKAYGVGDAPQLGDVQSAVPGYDGKVVGAASLPG
jgi:SpoIID/LytB domain protein